MSSAKHTEAAGCTAKVESTYNTESTPATTDAVRIIKPLPVLTPQWGYSGERGIANGGFGRHVRAVPAGRFINSTVNIEPKGRGAAYSSSAVEVPDVHRWLASAGFVPTVTTTGGSEKWDFTPTTGTGTPTSLSAWFYGEGELIKVNGIYSNLKITAEGIGIPVFSFDFFGTMNTDPTDIALPSLTYTVPTIVPPPAVGTTFTLGNFTGGVVRSFTFDEGRTISPRLNQNVAAGHAGFQPGPRDPVLEFVVETTALQGTPFHAATAIDPYQLQKAATSGLAFSLVVGATQYNRWKIISGQTQVVGVEPVGEGSVSLRKITLKPYVTGDQDNSDLTLRWD